MVHIQPIESADTKLLAFVYEVLVQSFPKEEYRDFEDFKHIASIQNEFVANIVRVNEQPIGILNFWQFTSFIFIEHFAILPENRDKGMGRLVLKSFLEKTQLPIILEVELPESEIQKRRVAFYKQLGFRLWTSKYVQPPYHQGSEVIPMQLMCFGNLEETEHFKHIRALLYRVVYNVPNSNWTQFPH